MAIYKEVNRYRDAVVYTGIVAAIGALLVGASSYYWAAETTGLYAISYLMLATLLCFVLFRLSRVRYRLKVTSEKINIKLDSVRKVRKQIPIKDIAEAVPIRSVRGLKHRRGTNIYGSADFYSVAGAVGVLIRMRNKHEYFVGSEQPEQVALVLQRLIQRY